MTQTDLMQALLDERIAVFKPCIPSRRMMHESARSTMQQPTGETVQPLPGVNVPVRYQKFVVASAAKGKDLRDNNTFETYSALAKACGSAPKVVPQADGSLLIEASDAKHTAELQSLSSAASLGGPLSSQGCRGVVHAKELLQYPEDRLQEEFADQGVVKVERISKRVDGVLTPTPTLILTYNLPMLPSILEAAWLTYQVKPYIPRPNH